MGLYYYGQDASDYLAHFGILGMKWGIRRYQNPDGTLTAEGKKRYGIESDANKVKSNELIATKMYETSSDIVLPLVLDATVLTGLVVKDLRKNYSVDKTDVLAGVVQSALGHTLFSIASHMEHKSIRDIIRKRIDNDDSPEMAEFKEFLNDTETNDIITNPNEMFMSDVTSRIINKTKISFEDACKNLEGIKPKDLIDNNEGAKRILYWQMHNANVKFKKLVGSDMIAAKAKMVADNDFYNMAFLYCFKDVVPMLYFSDVAKKYKDNMNYDRVYQNCVESFIRSSKQDANNMTDPNTLRQNILNALSFAEIPTDDWVEKASKPILSDIDIVQLRNSN